MRRLRSNVARRTIGWRSRGGLAALVACVLAAPLTVARAQTGPSTEGAPEFIFPIGARSVAMGEAGVIAAVGSDAVWWNPALISRGPREATLQLTSKATVADADAAGTVIYPVRGVGAFAITARYVNEGSQEATDQQGNPTGTFVRTAEVLAATFAAPFGDQFAFGFTAKMSFEAAPCSGSCNLQTGTPQTSALDLGAQYFLTRDSVVAIGAAVRNIGFNLQVHDAPQADQLPERAEAGIEYAPKIAALPKEARVRAAADVVSRLDDGQALGYRFGAELSWMERYQARVGYMVNGPTGSGATLGFGFNTGRLQLDFAQELTDLGGLGARPTFITLRYLF